jgi:hypothetical protein
VTFFARGVTMVRKIGATISTKLQAAMSSAYHQ